MKRFVAVCLVACGASPGRDAIAPAHVSTPAPVIVVEPAFAITFTPSHTPPKLGVRIRARARPGLEHWSSVTHATPPTTARDAKGPIDATWKDGTLDLARAPEGFVELTTELDAQAQGDIVVSDMGYARFYGEPLVLPVALAREKTHVSIDFDFAKAAYENAASSFGSGKHVETDIPLAVLSKGVWMAGPVYSARFDAFEGKDDFAWIGYSAFDPRWMSAEIATLRTAVSGYFGDGSPPPFTMLLAIDRRGPVESTPISIYPRYRGLFALVDVEAPWSLAARMSVAIALVSRFIGERLKGDPKVVAGLARYVAREVLLASGIMTPLEYADEINGEIATTQFSDPNSAIAETALAASASKEPMKKRIREWLAHDVALGASLLERRELGPSALGPCFTRVPTRFEELDLGFDEPKTRESSKITGVHGAAQRAGLREGDAVTSLRYDDAQAAHPVRVVVMRDGKKLEIKYRPVGRTKTAPGWQVIPGIDPTTCALP